MWDQTRTTGDGRSPGINIIARSQIYVVLTQKSLDRLTSQMCGIACNEAGLRDPAGGYTDQD